MNRYNNESTGEGAVAWMVLVLVLLAAFACGVASAWAVLQ